MPTWIQYAQALVTPVVAIAGIALAWWQFRLARQRLRFDLYDRRYKLYQVARRFVAEICREGRVSAEQVLIYHRDVGDAVFLLN
jgi:hypothetical protein